MGKSRRRVHIQQVTANLLEPSLRVGTRDPNLPGPTGDSAPGSAGDCGPVEQREETPQIVTRGEGSFPPEAMGFLPITWCLLISTHTLKSLGTGHLEIEACA